MPLWGSIPFYGSTLGAKASTSRDFKKKVTAQAYLFFIILFQSLAVTKEN
jgi:hypothetical protein